MGSENEAFDELMARLRDRDDDAAAAIFRRFTHRLTALARTQLGSMGQPRIEVEDVIQSVYKSFFTRCGQGQFAFDDWDHLWGLLTIITLRKCSNRLTYLLARKRHARAASAGKPSSPSGDLSLHLVDREPTPLEAAALADTVRALLHGLEEHDRQVVSLLLQGYTAQEIGLALACSERTVRRVRSRLKQRLSRLDDA